MYLCFETHDYSRGEKHLLPEASAPVDLRKGLALVLCFCACAFLLREHFGGGGEFPADALLPSAVILLCLATAAEIGSLCRLALSHIFIFLITLMGENLTIQSPSRL